MLNPIFYIPPIAIDSCWTYRVLGYAQVEHFTLVKWYLEYLLETARESTEGKFAYGESLFRDTTLIQFNWLKEVPLYTPPTAPINSKIQCSSVWNKINPLVGNNGMSADIAIQLRDSSNWTYFEFPVWE